MQKINQKSGNCRKNRKQSLAERSSALLCKWKEGLKKIGQDRTKRRRTMFIGATVFVLTISAALAAYFHARVMAPYGITTGTNYYTLSTGGGATDREDYYVDLNKGQSDLTITGYQVNEQDTKYAAFDLVLIPENKSVSIKGTTLSTGGTPEMEGNALIFRDIPLAFSAGGTTQTVTVNFPDSLTTNESVHAVVTRAYTDTVQHNAYVGDYFSLQMLQDEQMHNNASNNTATMGMLDYQSIPSYRNIYFVGDMTAAEQLTLNIPCYVNLLYAKLTLLDNVTIAHDYAGMFALDHITGQIDNSENSFCINARQGYYSIPDLAGIFAKQNEPYLKVTYGLKWDKDDTLKQEVLADAQEYLDRFVPQLIYDAVLLPKQYHNTGITYQYTYDDWKAGDEVCLTSGGAVVFRPTESVSGQITCQMMYEGAAIGSPITLERTLVGTSDAALQEAFAKTVSDYIQAQCTQVTIDGKTSLVLERDVNVKELIDAFLSDSQAKKDLKLVIPETSTGLYFALGKKLAQAASAENMNNGSEAGGYLAPKLSKLALTYSAANDTYSTTFTTVMADGSKEQLTAEWALLSTALLKVSSYSANADDQVIQAAFSQEQAQDITVRLNGLSIDERNALLLRYVNSIYYNNVKGTSPIIHIDQNAVYSGSVMRVDSNLNIQGEITNQIYMISGSQLAAFDQLGTVIDQNDLPDILKAPNGVTALNGAELLGDQEKEKAFFSIQNGALQLNRAISLPNDKRLVLVQTYQYADDAENRTFCIAKEVVIPTSGIGGGEDSIFISGNTYADFFKEGTYLSFDGKVFVPPITGVNLKMEIAQINGQAVTDPSGLFIQANPNGIGGYTLDIDLEEVPSTNTIVTVRMTFTHQVENQELIVSLQEYTFTVPGIYQYKRDIMDLWVYLAMLDTYGDYRGYLRSDDAVKAPGTNAAWNPNGDTFTCSYERLEELAGRTGTDVISLDYLAECGILTEAERAQASLPKDQAAGISLVGAELLTGTKKMCFDGVHAASLEAFAGFSDINQVLTELSLANCQITDAMLRTTYQGMSNGPLYKLNQLTTLNLDDNAITELASEKAILYRTITSFSLAHRDQNTDLLTSLSGVEQLPYLEEINVTGNQISVCDTLLQLEHLKRVVYADNTVSAPLKDGAPYYGTHGLVNLPTYTALLHKGVEVVLKEADDTAAEVLAEILDEQDSADPTVYTAPILQEDGYQITMEEEYMAVTINSIFYMSEYTSAAATPQEWEAEFYQQISNRDQAAYEKYQIKVENASEQIISITGNMEGTDEDIITVYKQLHYTLK